MTRLLKTAVVLILAILLPLRTAAGVTVGYCGSGHQDMAIVATLAHEASHEREAAPVDSSCSVCIEHCSSAAFAPSMPAVVEADSVHGEPFERATLRAPAFLSDQLDRPPLA